MPDCKNCDGHCCKYITVQIDEPKDDIDFEELKWFLCHKNVLVYIDHDGDWCVEFKTECKFQDPKTNLCTIYDGRPAVCAEHQTDECEVHGEGDTYWKRPFHKKEDIDDYRLEIRARREKQRLQGRRNAKAKKTKD